MIVLPDALLDLAAPWGGRSRSADLGGPVHWVDFGEPEADGTESRPPLVLVHGLGGSHLNWVQVAPALAAGRRVAAIDLPGFGLTPGADRDTGVRANAALLGRFVREVVGAPAVLVGNSMGGMVSLLLAAAEAEAVAGLVLIDPALPRAGARLDRLVALQFAAYATPVVGERVLTRFRTRFDVRQRVLGTVQLCFADAQRADPAVVAAGVELLTYRDTLPAADAEFLRAARSLLAVLGRGGRYASLIQGVRVPTLLVHGEQDRLVPIKAARRTATDNPAWATAWLPGVGHTPQLEVPEELLAQVLPWLDSLDHHTP